MLHPEPDSQVEDVIGAADREIKCGKAPVLVAEHSRNKGAQCINLSVQNLPCRRGFFAGPGYQTIKSVSSGCTRVYDGRYPSKESLKLRKRSEAPQAADQEPTA